MAVGVTCLTWSSQVALCGVEGSVRDISHVAFDNDKVGRVKALNAALAVDAMCRVVVWPSPLRSAQEGANHVQVKDANGFHNFPAVTRASEKVVNFVSRFPIQLAKKRAKDVASIAQWPP